MENWQIGGFGIYIHWPFCAAKCPYCDFNSHVRAEVDHAAWKRALINEINGLKDSTDHQIVSSVFFGGGTPSLMDPTTVAEVIEAIRAGWRTANNLEITLEANPGSVEADRFKAYAEAGVTRVSMGVQALNDTDLKALGRVHSVADARRAFDIAKSAFSSVSFDLIYARQNQTLSDWRSELLEALEMAVDHLSLYQLTIEQGTAFGDRFNRGKLRGLPPDDLAADMYEITQEICDRFGMPAYEISNHAKAGAQSHHNLIYWRGGDYLGIGPGAHGRLTLGGTRFATETLKRPEAWLEAVSSKGTGELARTVLSQADIANEYVMMGLRLSEGISLDRFKNLAGQRLSSAAMEKLSHLGMVELIDDRLRVTPQGRLVLNAVIKELLVS
ncbi:MAG: radical SAM family heme chaperone HemW [Dinoroseobacter sp.]|nr:radical SAM family heme chaperone HemW [Dinoroseobacter sp.]